MNRRLHAKYFSRFLNLLPPRLSNHDSTRATIAYFAVSGIDILDSLDLLSDDAKQNIINWIYSLQVIPSGDRRCGGFQGATTLNILDSPENCAIDIYKWGHLAMTYTSLAILVILGDDLSRVDRRAIIDGVAAVQRPDGSFSATIEGNEFDMRFVYCACCICFMLNDWGRVNKSSMGQYITNSIRYDGGVSQHFEMESHGGTTFCALAALQLSDQMHLLSPKQLEKVKRWLLFRQDEGFQGRPNKPIDTCYSFWIGSALKIVDAFELSNFNKNRDYVFSCQDTVVGGFSKWPGTSSDPFHTYFGLCGLSFLREPDLLEVMPSLNISMRAYERLKKLHKSWGLEKRMEVQLNIDL